MEELYHTWAKDKVETFITWSSTPMKAIVGRGVGTNLLEFVSQVSKRAVEDQRQQWETQRQTALRREYAFDYMSRHNSAYSQCIARGAVWHREHGDKAAEEFSKGLLIGAEMSSVSEQVQRLYACKLLGSDYWMVGNELAQMDIGLEEKADLAARHDTYKRLLHTLPHHDENKAALYSPLSTMKTN
jgi:hypothetical protein